MATKGDEMKRQITDESKTDPMIHILDAMMGGPSAAIQAQESRGQSQLVASELLPTKCSADDQTYLEAFGCKFGKPEPHDPMFRAVKLPKGWQKKRTDHSMWSDLVDAAGEVVASIFYKAASYDRAAFINVRGEYRTAHPKP